MISPKCGKEMEKGILEVDAGGYLQGALRWFSGLEKYQATVGRKRVVLGRGVLGAYFHVPGHHCSDCELAVIEYGSENE
ncbi:MAG: PF20097 family protein [Methanomassiliicoccales archaeon]|jgi:hypothetical protein|nr:PF20097 family protein [Methanomassiliicoccales archaeon]